MLSTILLLSLITAAQAASNPCQPSSDFTPFKYGTRWLQWDEHERDIYLEGFVDGGSVYFEFMLRQPERVRKEVFSKTTVMYNSDVLSPVVTSLYKDPANVFIRYDSMVFIARDKIAGKDVEPLLRKARQTDCGGSVKK
jgi:hypothetical protein